MNLIDMTQAAKMINAKPRKLRADLVKHGIFKQDPRTGHRSPKFEFIDKGLFVMEPTSFKRGVVNCLHNKIMVTGNGIEFLREFVANNEQNKAA